MAGSRVIISTATLFSRESLNKLNRAIGDAIVDERKYQNMKNDNNLPQPVRLDPSETVRLKIMLEDYDRLKKLADKVALLDNQEKKL